MKIYIKGAIIPNDDKWIYDWFEIESTCPKEVRAIIDAAKGEPLDVYIDSGGGSIFAGSDIYSALRAYEGRVNIHVTGLAASAASIIAMAGYSDISPTAMLMVHNVSCTSRGDYHDMDKSSEMLQQANKAMAAAYIAKTGLSESEVLAMMDKETWMPAADAVSMKLIDKIAESKNMMVASYNSPMLPQSVLDKVRNTVKNPLSGNSPEQADIFMDLKNKLQLERMRY